MGPLTNGPWPCPSGEAESQEDTIRQDHPHHRRKAVVIQVAGYAALPFLESDGVPAFSLKLSSHTPRSL